MLYYLTTYIHFSQSQSRHKLDSGQYNARKHAHIACENGITPAELYIKVCHLPHLDGRMFDPELADHRAELNMETSSHIYW